MPREVTLDLPTLPDEAIVVGAVVVYMTPIVVDGTAEETPEGNVRVRVEAKLVLRRPVDANFSDAIARALRQAVEQLTT